MIGCEIMPLATSSDRMRRSGDSTAGNGTFQTRAVISSLPVIRIQPDIANNQARKPDLQKSYVFLTFVFGLMIERQIDCERLACRQHCAYLFTTISIILNRRLAMFGSPIHATTSDNDVLGTFLS